MFDKNSIRTASVYAKTKVTLLVLNEEDFWFVFQRDGNDDVIQKLSDLKKSRKNDSNQIILMN